MLKNGAFLPIFNLLSRSDPTPHYTTISIACPFSTAASAAGWFYIAVRSAAMEKRYLLRVLCAASPTSPVSNDIQEN